MHLLIKWKTIFMSIIQMRAWIKIYLINSNKKNCMDFFLLPIPNGKRIWFWYETAPANASYLRISASNLKILHIVHKAGPFHILLWTIIFHFHQGYGLKSFKQNLVATTGRRAEWKYLKFCRNNQYIIKTGADYFLAEIWSKRTEWRPF